jgi:hypothetical protein
MSANDPISTLSLDGVIVDGGVSLGNFSIARPSVFEYRCIPSVYALNVTSDFVTTMP